MEMSVTCWIHPCWIYQLKQTIQKGLAVFCGVSLFADKQDYTKLSKSAMECDAKQTERHKKGWGDWYVGFV